MRDTMNKMTRKAFVLHFLAGALGACHSGQEASSPSHVVSAPPGAIDAERLARASREPDQWLMSGRDAGGTYFSPLADINSGNVARLGFAWEYRLGTHRGLEATPIVVDGVLYTS